MTDLEKALAAWNHFGRILAVHTIGEYAIIETERGFSPFINGESLNLVVDTLDGALVAAIAIKHDGRNTQAAHFFMRMIGADK